jgi:hypothetical protein
VESEAIKEDRPKSRMGAILISEALAARHNITINIASDQNVNHG